MGFIAPVATGKTVTVAAVVLKQMGTLFTVNVRWRFACRTKGLFTAENALIFRAIYSPPTPATVSMEIPRMAQGLSNVRLGLPKNQVKVKL